MKLLCILPLLLVLGGCAGLIPRLSDGSIDTGKIAEIASTAADSAIAGVELAGTASELFCRSRSLV